MFVVIKSNKYKLKYISQKARLNIHDRITGNFLLFLEKLHIFG